MKDYDRREAKLVPFYHVPKPPCVMLTAAQVLCVRSASWVAVDRPEVTLCKQHRDMMKDRKFKRITASRVDIHRLREQFPRVSSIRDVSAVPSVEFRSANG